MAASSMGDSSLCYHGGCPANARIALATYLVGELEGIALRVDEVDAPKARATNVGVGESSFENASRLTGGGEASTRHQELGRFPAKRVQLWMIHWLGHILLVLSMKSGGQASE